MHLHLHFMFIANGTAFKTVETRSWTEPCQSLKPIVIWDVLEMQRMYSHDIFNQSYLYLYLYSEACGGPNLLSVYSSVPVVALPVAAAMTTNLPGNWSYAGCLREPAVGKMFPYQLIWPTNNSALACMNQCAAFGYPAAGVEVSQKAYISIYHDLVTDFFISPNLYSVW